MTVEFDPAKDATNIAKHGVSLSRAADLEILVFLEDDRNEYGEVRYRAWGRIDGKGYSPAFADRDGRIRAISLRRAHKKEMRRHVPQAP
jgi:uncharacterized DUF497 family protein